MGQNVPFAELRPGSFINLNRTGGTGHAVVFVAFIDIAGNELATWSDAVVGFRYFSSQGGYEVGSGGLDYRYAVFSQHGAPVMPYKRDLNVIESDDQLILHTGVMLHPSRWQPSSYGLPVFATSAAARTERFSRFDAAYFDGATADDALPASGR